MGGPLNLYDVVMHGVPTRMKLNEADADRYNATLVGAPEPEPEADAEPPAAGAAKPTAKKRTPANKARTAAADKDGGTGGGD